MPLTREDLRNQLKRREISPVYLLFGPETHLRDIAAKTITDLSFAPGDFRDFNESVVQPQVDGNLEKALAAAEQLPMMAARRVVRITDVDIRDRSSRHVSPRMTKPSSQPTSQTLRRHRSSYSSLMSSTVTAKWPNCSRPTLLPSSSFVWTIVN